MTRLTLVTTCVLTWACPASPVHADEPPKKLTATERQDLEAKREELNAAAEKAGRARRFGEAVKACEEALAIARRLYPKAEYPDGHANLATSLNNLAFLLAAQDKLADAEPLHRDALAMRQRLFQGDDWDLAQSLNSLGAVLEARAQFAEAETLHRDALAMRRRLAKGDHPAVAVSLNNLAFLLQAQGKLAEAEPLFRDSLGMRKRLIKGDHPAVANGLNNLALLFHNQGKISDAKPLYRDALDMNRRLFKGDHPAVALSLNNMASILLAEGKSAEAETLHRETLAMRQRMYPGQDHRDLTQSLSNLASTLRAQGKLTEAERLEREALAMRQRLIKGDHPDVANSLNGLAAMLEAQGKLTDAEPLYRDALAMAKRVFKGDHPDVAGIERNLAGLLSAQNKFAEAERQFRIARDMYTRLNVGDHPDVALCLNNLAFLLQAQGKLADAEQMFRDVLDMAKRRFTGDHGIVALGLFNVAGVLHRQGRLADAALVYRESLAMYRRHVQFYARQKSEGDALTLLPSLPGPRNGYLSVERTRNADPALVYPEVWESKGLVARVYEQRQQAARATAADPKAAAYVAELADTRRRRAELILAPEAKDPVTRETRLTDIRKLEKKIAELDESLRPLLPIVARADRLASASPGDLQKVLPADAALVDLIRYTFMEYDPARPGRAGEKRTDRYLAFVITRDKVAWLDLEAAKKIDAAVAAWRAAITSGKEIDAEIPVTVREFLWDKVRKELPAGVQTVYVSPDSALCHVPWAALPGDRPGTILLEDFAIATIPHAPFLLDRLWPQDAVKDPPAGALVVGGVRYDADPAPAVPAAVAARGGDPLVKPGAKLGWGFLDNTVGEAAGVAGLAAAKSLSVTTLTGERATPPAVLAALPKAKWVHFATHGFFADPSFLSVFQLDPRDYTMSQRGERIGPAANSPLVMTGLVFAGANHPKAPGRGIVTGEALVDLDLSGLELAVLSACETGVGDVAGGEGAFGLQRAFHLAGTRDVVASLWKVPDQPTAALMALFYRNLWTRDLSPMESLRQAQLEVYKNPGKIADLAKGFRGTFAVVPGAGEEVATRPDPAGKAHPRLWAAFMLSGVGR